MCVIPPKTVDLPNDVLTASQEEFGLSSTNLEWVIFIEA
jgi:hypothetical protein